MVGVNLTGVRKCRTHLTVSLSLLLRLRGSFQGPWVGRGLTPEGHARVGDGPTSIDTRRSRLPRRRYVPHGMGSTSV